MTYRGSCHCGGIQFRFESEPITKGCRCNCSLCLRRGAVMSDVYLAREQLTVEKRDTLTLYRWGDHMMNHYFCSVCGVFPFSDVIEDGRYRVNLGCVDGIDLLTLEVRQIDGRSF